MSDDRFISLEDLPAKMGELLERAEAAEADKARLEAALRQALPFVDTHAGMMRTKSAYQNVLRCVDAIHAALAGSPAPERDIQEEMQDAYQFGTVPSPVSMEEINNMTHKERAQYEAERAVVKAARSFRHGDGVNTGELYDALVSAVDAYDALAKAREQEAEG